nr:protein FANTASTIC FOUR 1-like [Coffea arabica]
MATACGSLQHIFDRPLPESPTLLEPFSSWKQIKTMNPIPDSSFAEIFGEVHFKENEVVQSVEIERPLDNKDDSSKSPTSSYCPTPSHEKHYKHSNSFSSVNSESFSLCTEGLGFESSDDVEDLGNETGFDIQQEHQPPEEKICFFKESKRSRTIKGSFPPPISCIGRTGRPWVSFRSYRQDGRFILQEIRFPTQEFLHACREDGRLRLQLIQSDDEILEGEEDEEDEEDYYDSEEVNLENEGDDSDDEHEHR